MIRICITDDHPIVLDGLKNLIQTQEDMVLIGLFNNAKDTLKSMNSELPDVLLLDINLPDKSGIALSKELKVLYPELLIIILSVHNERAVIGSALDNKVDGYLLKNSAGEEIIEAIHKVIGGEVYLCKQSKEIYTNKEAGLKSIPVITRREKEILSLIAEGFTSTQIADKLFVSMHTVESHRKNILEKFDAKSMPLIIKLATEYKLI